MHLVEIRKTEDNYRQLVSNLKKFSHKYSSEMLLSNKMYEKYEEVSNEL